MRITVLGCAGTFPGPASPCSGYLVEHDGYRLVLDLGAGSLGSLQRHVDLLDVDAIYLSHLHADHCIDLVAYSYARRYHPGGVPPALPVYGPKGTRERIERAFEEQPQADLLDVFDFREVEAGIHRFGPLTMTTDVMNHPVECHGMRIEADGRVLAYSADTDVTEALVGLARDADLFLCEASWLAEPTPPPGIHLSGVTAGEHAARAGAKRLVLTHVMPFTDRDAVLAEARTTYDGPVELAECGVTYDV